MVRKMRPEICIDNSAKPISAELPTTETPHQNWGETIQEVIQQEQEKAERRLAEERTRLDTGTHRQSSRGSKADYFGLDRSGESAMRKFR